MTTEQTRQEAATLRSLSVFNELTSTDWVPSEIIVVTQSLGGRFPTGASYVAQTWLPHDNRSAGTSEFVETVIELANNDGFTDVCFTGDSFIVLRREELANDPSGFTATISITYSPTKTRVSARADDISCPRYAA